jgi:spore germination protein GerM
MSRLAAALLTTLLLGGCGVPPDRAPRQIAGAAIPTPSGAGGAALVQPTAVSVYLVRGRHVVPVQRVVDAPASPDRRLTALVQGPTDREAEAGLRTSLAGGIRAGRVTVRGGTAVVTLAASFVDAGTEEQILALAQLVFTLTESDGVRAVRFTVEDSAVSVPRADGSLTAGPVRRSDYLRLGP